MNRSSSEASAAIEPEFNREFDTSRLSSDGFEIQLEATKEELEALAKRFAISGIGHLFAQLTIKKTGHGIEVKGKISAEVIQTCVVSLEPVPQKVDEELNVLLVPGADIPEPDEEDIELLDPDSPDLVELSASGIVNLGEIIAESVALALDPYPRKPGAALSADLAFESGDSVEREPSPFAVLDRLKPSKH